MNDKTQTLNNLNKKKNNHMTLLAILIVFSLPPVSAYLIYFLDLLPDSRSNKGVLISPIVQFPEFIFPESAVSSNGQTINSIADFKGKWTLLMLVGQSCDLLCEKNIYLMRQVQTALGKDSHNVERLLIVNKRQHIKKLRQFLNDYPKMFVISGDNRLFNRLGKPVGAIINDLYQRIFIIDPQGRLMMYYAQALEPEDLLSDLKRLIMVNT